MWPANVAGRGSDEIASCLLNFCQSLPVVCKHLIVYSDSSGRQNKNFYIVCFWVYAIIRGSFEIIDHKFLTPGHTYLPSDQDFALFEKKKKENEVFIPYQWFSLVESIQTKKPFQVARIKREDFKSLKSFSKKFVNRKKTTDKEQLSFRKIVGFVSQNQSLQRCLFVILFRKRNHGRFGILVELHITSVIGNQVWS